MPVKQLLPQQVVFDYRRGKWSHVFFNVYKKAAKTRLSRFTCFAAFCSSPSAEAQRLQ